MKSFQRAFPLYGTAAPIVGRSFADNALHFFRGYFSLCQMYQVVGSARLVQSGIGPGRVYAKLECTLFFLDGKRANETYKALERRQTELRQRQRCREDANAAGKACIEAFYGCGDLHHAFQQIGQYQYGDPDVTISCKCILFTRLGARWLPTLTSIKQDLGKQRPNARIELREKELVVTL